MSSIRDTTRRPLTARSVIASTLLGVDPPRLPALALVRSGELFGLREGATRTALSRMAANGEVVADDAHYSLAGDLLDRHARQQSARARRPSSWDGTWVAAVVTADRRNAQDRAAFRDAARRLKLAEIREGLWMRPDNRGGETPQSAQAVVNAQATWLRGARPDHPTDLVGSFAVDEWSGYADGLIGELERWQPALDDRRTDVLGETFVIAADVLRHLVADPELPSELVPTDWPADRLRDRFERFDRAFKETWRSWHRSFQDS